MNITKDTKIGDLIPEGWVLDIEKSPSSQFDTGYLKLSIPTKVEEEKNFNWYVNKYFGIENYIEGSKYVTFKDYLLSYRYNEVPFELKIGLLKFICDDNDTDLIYCIYNIKENNPGFGQDMIRKLCPKEFLESIFKINL